MSRSRHAEHQLGINAAKHGYSLPPQKLPTDSNARCAQTRIAADARASTPRISGCDGDVDREQWRNLRRDGRRKHHDGNGDSPVEDSHCVSLEASDTLDPTINRIDDGHRAGASADCRDGRE
jgi:hypothetical protein